MSKMVSARIPDALYDQGCAQLEQLGATQTQLVKAAFDYLLRNRSLPPTSGATQGKKKRALTKEQRDSLAARLAACRLDVRIPGDVAYDKEVIRRAREAKHEALS